MKAGVASDTLTLEDDGVNLCGFSFGNVLTAEKTQLLRGKNVNAYITTTTPEGAGRVYAAKWTGAPDAFTREIITDIDGAGEPIMGANWVLDGVSIFCTEDISGDPNTYSGAFTVPADAENFAVFLAPGLKQLPTKFEVSDFYLDKDPAISGFYLYAPEEAGEKYLIEDTKYAKFGLNTRPVIDGVKQSYTSLRYTINTADTPLPAGQLIKGKADIEGNWDATGSAVDYLTINNKGNVNLSTSFIVYPGEGLTAGQTSTNKFWWSYEQSPGVWTKIPESEITHTAVKDVAVPQTVTIPEFEYKAQDGDKLRCFANSSVNDGAFIESTSPSEYLCESTIDFTEFVPGSEDEPVTSIYVQDELINDWELTAGTDGHLRTLLVGDLPENIDHHVLRSNFSGNDFMVDEFGVITILDVTPPVEYTEISANVDLDDYRNYIVDTTSGTVTINIPYEQDTAFSVRDWKKEFDTNSCFVTIRDELDAIVHTAELDRKDRGYIFYTSGGTWKYGEIGKGAVVDIASDHVATVDFPCEDRVCIENVNLAASAWTTITYPGDFEVDFPSSVSFYDAGGTMLIHNISQIEVINSKTIRVDPGLSALNDIRVVVKK